MWLSDRAELCVHGVFLPSQELTTYTPAVIHLDWSANHVTRSCDQTTIDDNKRWRKSLASNLQKHNLCRRSHIVRWKTKFWIRLVRAPVIDQICLFIFDEATILLKFWPKNEVRTSAEPYFMCVQFQCIDVWIFVLENTYHQLMDMIIYCLKYFIQDPRLP